MKVLITGGNGFIGHHVIQHFLINTTWDIAIIDKLNYASCGYERLKEIDAYSNTRIKHYSYDLVTPISEYLEKELKDCTYIIHLGAETHVDNSIATPVPFVTNNILSTLNLLEFARKCNHLEKFIYFSTDEVFGPADPIKVPNGFKEWDRYNSTNPYSASKAGGEELALAWGNTYGVPVIITHTMNVFGERQHPEKFIPKTIKNIIEGNKVLIHSDPTRTRSGSRYWIHARNVAAALLFILERGTIRDKYNIVGQKEVTNLDIAKFIAECIPSSLEYEMIDFHSSRPGHDLRYGLDGSKLKEMGFEYPRTFEESIAKTITWTIEHNQWLYI